VTSTKNGGATELVEQYDVAADSKRRISLRGARWKHYHVKAFANGTFVLEPRVLVAPDQISARTLRMIEKSVANLKKGRASKPIDLSLFQD
jgi:hypothetical protein